MKIVLGPKLVEAIRFEASKWPEKDLSKFLGLKQKSNVNDDKPTRLGDVKLKKNRVNELKDGD